MRIFFVFIGAMVLVTCALSQSNKIESSQKDKVVFLADQDINGMIHFYNDFKFSVSFEKDYRNELILIQDVPNKRGSIFIIKWDSLGMAVYHEEFQGNGLNQKKKVVALDSTQDLHKSFISLVNDVKRAFYKQKGVISTGSPYKSNLALLNTNKKSPNFGLFCFNGKEFRSDDQYPSRDYQMLIDFIVLEFPGLAH
jgi:hypothetical protein